MWTKIIGEDCHMYDKLEQLVNDLDKIPLDPENIGLLSGEAGRALFYAYYGRYATNERYIEKASAILVEIIEITNKQQHINPLFSNGTTGVLWVINHLMENGFIDCDFSESFDELDDYLSGQMLHILESSANYDFLHGSLGIANYLLKNRKHDGILQQHIKKLEHTGITNGESIYWNSIIENSSNENETVINLGLSHGVTSIAAHLNKYIPTIGETNETILLLKKIIHFIRNCEQSMETRVNFFPNWISNKPAEKNSGLRWCYGDLGIAYTLYTSSKLLKDKELEAYSLQILIKTSERKDANQEGVLDAGLCHGAMGIAHIYNRLYQTSTIINFKNAAKFWYDTSFQFATKTDGIAGFQSFNKLSGWKTKPYLLEGASGIGLALIAALSDFEPKWDECLLLS